VTYEIRPAQPADLPRLMELCAEHARYERTEPPAPEAADRLASALFGATPRAYCLVAVDRRDLIGYASFAPEFSTWQGRDYAHLDCLYLVETHRRRGLGTLLLAEVAAYAARSGLAELQWQTPDWNTDAIEFYQHHGATPRRKVRFSLPLTPGTEQS